MPRYIDADALMLQLARKKAEAQNKRYTEGFNDALMRFRSMVHSAPTISPDDVRGVGEWIRISGFHLDHEYHPARYQCDQCKHFVDSGDDRNYCPSCGARMKGDTNGTTD